MALSGDSFNKELSTIKHIAFINYFGLRIVNGLLQKIKTDLINPEYILTYITHLGNTMLSVRLVSTVYWSTFI